MTLPILFLDIDGVLNSGGFWERRHGDNRYIVMGTADPVEKLDPAAIVHLNNIVEAVDCQVILSSSWRKDAPLLSIAGWLREAGFVGTLAGKTPEHWNPYYRHVEIEAWLAEHGLDERHPHVALDDEPGPPGKVHWVATRYAVGLTAAEADRAISVLRGSP